MSDISKLSRKSQIPQKTKIVPKKKEDYDVNGQGNDLLSIIGDKVEISHIMGPSTAIALEKAPDGKTHIKGDIGKTWAEYDIIKEGNVIHIKGDIGDSWADYKITGDVNNLHIEGDVGRAWADYTVKKEGNVSHVKGDVGDSLADYTITREENVTCVKGDLGNSDADYTVKREGNVTHVKGDMGEEYSDYKIIQEGNVIHIKGDTGGETVDYKIVQEGNITHVTGDVGSSTADYNIFRSGEMEFDSHIREEAKIHEVIKPEMKPAADKMIDRMYAIAGAGGGEIPLLDILNLIPDVPPHIAGEIEKRGAVKFKAKKTIVLDFENKGKKMEFEIPVDGTKYTLKIPEVVKGEERVDKDHFTMYFNPSNTIKVGKFFIYFGLEKLEVFRDKIFMDFEGDMADTLIKFA